MLVEVYNSYHNTTEIMEGTLSQVKKHVEESLEGFLVMVRYL